MITLRYSTIKKPVYILLALPFCIFSIGWLKWYWAIPAIAVIGITVYFGAFRSTNRKKDKEITNTTEKTVQISRGMILSVALLSLVWVWMSGIGGLWGQSSDFVYRNAIYRDIVLRDWPVIYPATGHALVYYIGFWLFPALFGKAALLFGVSEETAFNVAQGSLYVWTALIICIIFLFIIFTVNADTEKKQFFIMLLFIFFSGIDVIGNIGYSPEMLEYHYEWWAWPYQYSSFTTCLFWVYNQALPAWLCFLCLRHEKNVRNYVFIGMMCLFNAPLPFVGWMIYCLYYAVRLGMEKIKTKRSKEFVKDICSISNILCVICIFPLIATYLLSNEAIHGSGAIGFSETKQIQKETLTEHESENEVLDIDGQSGELEAESSEDKRINRESGFSTYISFVIIEFGIFMLLVFIKYKKEPIFYVTLISLLLIPLFKLGHGRDFCMRVSVPGIFMVFLFVGRYLMEETSVLKKKHSVERLSYIVLVVMLVIGAFTPGMEFYRGTKQVFDYGIGAPEYDSIYTLGCDGPYDDGEIITYGNFVAVDLEKQTFFKVFSKKISAGE